MRKTTINYRTPTGTTDHKDVDARPIQGTLFAITKPMGHPRETWSLTHVPTGFRACGSRSQATLRKVAKALSAMPIDWNENTPDVFKRHQTECVETIKLCGGCV